MNILSHHKWFAIALIVVSSVLTPSGYAVGPNDRFTNIGSISNTRHNLTQSTTTISANMDAWRNNYGEVCVYCHTPHGSQTLQQMPLWNRTVKATTYTVYNSISLTQTVAQPGNNSLTCLTCHDGQTAIDSIINMPGSGMSNAGQATTQNLAFLNAWNNSGTDAGTHLGLNSTDKLSTGYVLGVGDGTGNGAGCLVCHSETGSLGGGLVDFTIFNIGLDLTNDHPVGITFPAASGVGSDFKLPAGAKGTSRYFDVNSNGHMDTDEVRLYDTGGSVKVECASCHDPHGVLDPENSPYFKPTFLRVKNGGATGSALCLTCHDK